MAIGNIAILHSPTITAFVWAGVRLGEIGFSGKWEYYHPRLVIRLHTVDMPDISWL